MPVPNDNTSPSAVPAESAAARPWEMPAHGYVIDTTGEGYNFSGGDWDITPPLGESGPVAIASTRANAELIVRAVNAHDVLVAALRKVAELDHEELYTRETPYDGYAGGYTDGSRAAFRMASDIARAALSLASCRTSEPGEGGR